MTVVEAQTVLATISNHIDGKTGIIKQITIYAEGEAIVNIDFEAFKSAFAGQNAEKQGKTWKKSVGNVTYKAVDHGDQSTYTVPI